MEYEPNEYRKRAIDNYFEKKQSPSVTPLTIFFAVLAAVLVAFFLRATYIEWQLRQAAEVFKQQMAIGQKQLEQQKRQQLQRFEANRKAREQQLLQQRIAKHRVEQQKQAAISAGITRNIKYHAWNAYYKPIKDCESSNEEKDLMTCGNDHAKAKKRFETLWANGQLR